MAHRVLVPINGLSPTLAALEHATSLDGDLEITILQVVAIDEREGSVRQTVLSDALEDRRDAAEGTADRVVRKAQEHATKSGATLRTAVEEGHPADRIAAYAADNDADRIVMGSHGRSGFTRLLLGSPSEAVARRSSVPVTTIQEHDDGEDDDNSETSAIRDAPLFRGIN